MEVIRIFRVWVLTEAVAMDTIAHGENIESKENKAK